MVDKYQKKFYIKLIIYLTILGLGLYFVIFKLIGEFTQLKNDIKSIKEKIAQEEMETREMPEVEHVYNLISVNKEKINNLLPQDEDRGKLISFVEYACSKNNCTIIDFKFSESQKKSKKKKEELKTLPFSFTIQATYENFLSFLSEIKNFPRLLKIDSFSIEKDSKDPNILKINLTCQAFYKEDK